MRNQSTLSIMYENLGGAMKVKSETELKTVDELFSALEYGSYAANRGYGMTHEQLLSIGIGNEQMKNKYENK